MSELASPTFSALAARRRNVTLPSFTSGEVCGGGPCRGGWAVAGPAAARANTRPSRDRVRVMRGSSDGGQAIRRSLGGREQERDEHVQVVPPAGPFVPALALAVL